MTDSQIETAARALCRLTLRNPDMMEPDHAANARGMAYYECLAWKNSAEEIRHHLRIHQAIAIASAKEPDARGDN